MMNGASAFAPSMHKQALSYRPQSHQATEGRGPSTHLCVAPAAVVAGVVTATDLASKLVEMGKTVFPGKKEGTVTCHVENETQFGLSVDKSWHKTGKYAQSPGYIAPFTKEIFTLSRMGGNASIRGAIRYKIDMTENDMYVTFAWNNVVGRDKANVELQDEGMSRYNVAKAWDHRSLNTRTKETLTLTGTDEDGNAANFSFTVISTPGSKYNTFSVVETLKPNA
jgi:hypothetical protein